MLSHHAHSTDQWWKSTGDPYWKVLILWFRCFLRDPNCQKRLSSQKWPTLHKRVPIPFLWLCIPSYFVPSWIHQYRREPDSIALHYLVQPRATFLLPVIVLQWQLHL